MAKHIVGYVMMICWSKPTVTGHIHTSKPVLLWSSKTKKIHTQITINGTAMPSPLF